MKEPWTTDCFLKRKRLQFLMTPILFPQSGRSAVKTGAKKNSKKSNINQDSGLTKELANVSNGKGPFSGGTT